jgi:hypothetical protein
MNTAIFYSDAEPLIKLIMSKSEMLDKKIIDFDEKHDAREIHDLEE